MELYKTKAFALLLVLFLSCGCSSDDGFLALNSKEKIFLKYDSKEKALKGFDEPFLIFFYSSTCGYCTEQAKYLKELENTGFKMLAVIGDKPKYTQALKHTHGLNIPIIYEYKDVNYLSNAVGGISGVPVIVFFDKQGNVVQRYNGLISLKRLKQTKFNLSS